MVAVLAFCGGAFGQPKPTAEYVRVQGQTIATIHRPVTSSFSDVSTSDPFFEHVQILAERGITLGCGGGLYCASGPSSVMTREQMAVFIIRSIAWAQTGNPEEFRCGPPPGVPCGNTAAYFQDYDPSRPFFAHVQKLYELGITAGCSVYPECPGQVGGRCYCPADFISNGAVAVFAARARMVRERKCANSTNSMVHEAAAENRAACDALITHTANPYYSDVPANHFWFKWIQFTRDKLVVTNERVPDCYAPGNLFCPENAVSIPAGYRGTMTRPQMAYYLVRGILGDLSF